MSRPRGELAAQRRRERRRQRGGEQAQPAAVAAAHVCCSANVAAPSSCSRAAAMPVTAATAIHPQRRVAAEVTAGAGRSMTRSAATATSIQPVATR